MITMKRISISALLATCWFCQVGVAAEDIDHEVIAAIKEEGIQHSQAMKTLSYLTDVHGPRFIGTPGYYAAAEWARQQLSDWGLDASLEPFPADYLGWGIESHSVEMTFPRYMRLSAVPAAWASGTPEVSGELVQVQFDDLEALQQHQGKLKNKILVLPVDSDSRALSQPGKHPWSAEELREKTQAINPSGNEPEERFSKYLREGLEEFEKRRVETREIVAWLKKEGVIALLEGSPRDYGVIRVSGEALLMASPENSLPYFILSKEHHGRLVRSLAKGITPTVKLSLSTRYYDEPDYNRNVIAEIKGSDRNKRDEVVLAGAHFDSWHVGTGATDNGVNSAVMMEALRILKTLDLKMDRTVRIGLWGAEESAYEGSLGYAREHYGNAPMNDFTDEQAKVSVYFNLDNGGGKIRGVHLQGNEKARVFFTDNLAPFAYLGANHVSALNEGTTDHVVFDELNIPAFTLFQDMLDYYPRTHHTTMDVYELVDEEAIKQNAVIMASLIYHAATRDELLPRKKLLPPITDTTQAK
jgi:hypothetical protein